MPTNGVPTTEADWNGAMNRLRELGASADPRAFQRWDVIIARMAHVDSPASDPELAALRADREWESRWRPALVEVSAGRPLPYSECPESSEVLIQTAHNILRFERLSGRRVSEWESIVEFGGGFGGMCRLAHALGFSGSYLIFDLAPFTLLQGYYLTETGILGRGSRVALTSDFAEMERFVGAGAARGASCLVGTWSLSETPVALRERVKPLVETIGHYWLAFQGRYGEVDNLDYFTRCWPGGSQLERILHRPDDYYLVGAAGS